MSETKPEIPAAMLDAAAEIAAEADQRLRLASEEFLTLGEKWFDLRAILRRIIASADECDVPTGAGVPLVSIDARLITEARELMK